MCVVLIMCVITGVKMMMALLYSCCCIAMAKFISNAKNSESKSVYTL